MLSLWGKKIDTRPETRYPLLFHMAGCWLCHLAALGEGNTTSFNSADIGSPAVKQYPERMSGGPRVFTA